MIKDLTPLLKIVNEETKRIGGQESGFHFDNHSLDEGIYFKFNYEKTIDENIKDGQFLVVDKKEDISNFILRDWFKKRDYYSVMLNKDTNKSIDQSKNKNKVHSTNYLTLFVKRKNMFGETDKFSISEMNEKIQQIYNEIIPNLENQLFEIYPLTFRKKKHLEIEKRARDKFFSENFPILLQHLDSPKRGEEIKKIQQFWKRYFSDFIVYAEDLANQHKVKNYVKVFFEKSIKIYELEYLLYILPRIFNVNKYNQLKQGEIVGLPAYDISMNAKKPYFELKTMKAKVPTRVTLEDALIMKDIYGWLEKQGKYKVHIRNFDDVFGVNIGEESKRQTANAAYHFSVNGKGSVNYFDNVPFGQDETINMPIKNTLRVRMKTDGEFHLKHYDVIKKPSELHYQISYLFFNKYLQGGLLGDEIPKVNETVFTSEMQSIYILVRQALYDYIYKSTNYNIKPFVIKYSMQLIENQLLRTFKGLNYSKVADAYNFRLALIERENYKEEIDVADIIGEMYSSLQEKLSERNAFVTCENNNEFFFVTGQVAYYLLTKSESHNKNYGMAESVIKVKNVAQLKDRIRDLFETYGHEITLGNFRFKNAYAMIEGYETNEKITGKNKSMLMAGLLGNNIFFQKQNKEEGEN